jgi:hypothetical protein
MPVLNIYHLEALVSVGPGLVARCRVYARFLACVLGCFQDFGDGRFELWVKFTKHWMSDIVAQVVRAHEEQINPVDSCDLLDLIAVSACPNQSP